MADCNRARGTRIERILTIDPRIRRIGAAYFEGAVLADWSIRNVRRDPPDVRVRKRLVPTVVRMLDRYAPTVLLLPDVGPHGVRRSTNVRDVIEAVAREAASRGTEVVTVSERQVKETFERVRKGAGRNKQTINEIVADWFPEISTRLPKARRLWDSEAHATPLFDAIARWCAWRGLPAKTAAA